MAFLKAFFKIFPDRAQHEVRAILEISLERHAIFHVFFIVPHLLLAPI
jgi:hypothetical protein